MHCLMRPKESYTWPETEVNRQLTATLWVLGTKLVLLEEKQVLLISVTISSASEYILFINSKYIVLYTGTATI